MSSQFDDAILNNVLLIAGDPTKTGSLFQNLPPAYHVFVCSNMEEIQQVLEKISTPLIICQVENTPGLNGNGGFIKKLNELIAAHLHNSSLNVDRLASLMNMSRPTFYRKIKTITDLTPNELIHLARLQQAAKLLETGNYKVFEIAGMVGFHSQSSFGKAFIKQFKVTPTQYLRMKKTTGRKAGAGFHKNNIYMV